jgi:FG-GAP repeat protein/fibronectin type III domain protein/hemolysin type calcium-binding protein
LPSVRRRPVPGLVPLAATRELRVNQVKGWSVPTSQGHDDLLNALALLVQAGPLAWRRLVEPFLVLALLLSPLLSSRPAAASIGTTTITLPTGSIQISAAATDDLAGFSVAGAGDVNGDGFADLLIGAPHADANGSDSGAASLLFGKASGWSTITLDDSGLDPSVGVLIKGAAADDGTGVRVAGVRDVNGDGYADLLVGALGADANGSDSGAAYLLLAAPPGKASQFGTTSADTRSGSSGTDRLVGNGGDDLLLGKGGSDVLYGAADDDILAVSSTSFRRLDGGSGFNTLRLDGDGLSLDLTNRKLANRLSGIDAIDLSGPGAQHLTLDRLAVVNLDDLSNTLLVFLGPGDSLDKGSNWEQLAPEQVAGFPFQVFRRGAALLKIGQPSGPSGLTVQPGSAQATVSFTPLPSGGTCPVTGYLISVYQVTTLVKTVETSSSPVLIQDLQNGVAYTFTVQARSCVGLGPASTSGPATLGPATVRPDGVFLSGSGTALGGPGGYGGDNLYDPSGGGAGGSNVSSGDGPTIARGASRSLPFRIENDGSKADRIKLKSVSSSRSLSGITITVNGLHVGDATAELAVSGGKLDGNLVVQVGAGAATGKYVVRITLQANGTSDPAQSDSVTLRFVVS